jgi:hypothetical protein
MTNRSFLLVAAVALAASACGSNAGDVSGTQGALQQSTTTTACAPNDTACQNDGLDGPLAVGARLPLDVRITARGEASPELAFEAARDDVIGVSGAELVGKAPGWSSVLIAGADHLVLDFLTLSVAMPDRFEIYRLTKDGAPEASPLPSKIQLAPGDDIELTIRAFSGATRLLGDLDCTWTVDGTVGTLLDSGRRASRRLRVKQAGPATLAVKTATATKTLSLEVLP